MTRLLFKAFLYLALACQFGSALAAEKVIPFGKPGNSANLQGIVLDGYIHSYVFNAKAGQGLSVALSANEKNAVFQIYLPGYTSKRVAGSEEIRGGSLPKAGPGEDATNWVGVLPTPGKYLIVVGSTNGNANYKMTVALK
jgi:hypothetical protein